MSGKYICKLCNKEFSTKSNLTRHTQTVKSCNGPECPEKKTFSCEFCKKELTSKDMLAYHKNICKLKNNKSEVEELKIQVQMMATELNKMKDMKEKSVTNTFNITNNNYGSILNCLTQEVVQESFKNFSMKDLLSSDGQKTLADLKIACQVQNILFTYAKIDQGTNFFIQMKKIKKKRTQMQLH